MGMGDGEQGGSHTKEILSGITSAPRSASQPHRWLFVSQRQHSEDRIGTDRIGIHQGPVAPSSSNSLTSQLITTLWSHPNL
jgi:hypothetical protein